MPLYDYQCQHCHTIFEVPATFKEKEAALKPECPHCQSTETRQLLTAGLLLQVVTDKPSHGTCACGTNDGSGCCGGR
jgi:putative FmdB family regulatory protein